MSKRVYCCFLECATVTCKLTIDNIVEFVKYNDNDLTISGGDANKWTEEKEITFQSCDYSSPGTLEIRGTDQNGGGHCVWAGLLLHCVASDNSSPWHNFVSGVTNWKDKNGGVLCQNDQGFVDQTTYPFIASLLANGAKKIWTEGEKSVNLLGSPTFSK